MAEEREQGEVELKKQRVGEISCLLGVLFGFGEPRHAAMATHAHAHIVLFENLCASIPLKESA